MAFSYYKSVTLDHTQAGATDSTDWPLTIGVGVGPQAADTDLKTVGNGGFVQNSNGYDIRPYSDSGLTTPLAFELVYYDGANGKLEMHVKISTLSHTTDTVIYLAFGDSGISTDGSSNTTWNSNFKGVWHLPDGTTLTANDSTSNANNGTQSGSPAAGVGAIDGGVHFDGTNQGINVGTAPATALSGSFTLSGWYKGTGYQSLWGHRSVNSSRMLWLDSGVNLYAVAENRAIIHGITVSSGVWNFITWTYDNTGHTSKLYVNGVLGGSASYTFVEDDLNDTGLLYDGNQPHNGDFDEFRISNNVKLVDWLLADYNSQKASSTFIAWGAKTSTGGAAFIAPKPFFAKQAVNRASTY